MQSAMTEFDTATGGMLFAPDAERWALGAAIFSQDAADDLCAEVGEAEFHDANRLLFRAIRDLAEKGKGGNVSLVLTAMAKLNGHEREVYQQEGGDGWLAELARQTPPLRNLPEYIAMIRSASVRRALNDAAGKVLEASRDRDATPEEMLGTAETAVMTAADVLLAKRVEVEPIERIACHAMRAIEARMTRGEGDGLKTGFHQLDKMTGGLRPGELAIIGARPSQGKTSLGLNIAENVSLADKVALFVSLEMSREEIGERLLAGLAGVNLYKLRNGNLSRHDLQDLVEANARLSETKLCVDDAPTRRVGEIAAAARRMKRRGGLDMLIVDYLQIVTPDNPRDVRQEQVAKIARRLKGIARELRVPVIALAQVNRRSAQAKERPNLADLRESGALEQEADVVLFIHQPSHYETAKAGEKFDSSRSVLAELHLDKQRNGPRGKVDVLWQPMCARFTNPAQSRDVEETAPREAAFDAYNQGELLGSDRRDF